MQGEPVAIEVNIFTDVYGVGVVFVGLEIGDTVGTIQHYDFTLPVARVSHAEPLATYCLIDFYDGALWLE